MPIHVKKLTVRFPGLYALKDVDITFGDGRVHAVLGANGSGKSTLVKVLTGIYSPEPAAHIGINGQKFQEIKDPNMAKRLGIRAVHQEAPLIDALSIAESIAVMRGYPKNKFGKIQWKKLYEYSEELLRFWDIDLPCRKLVGQISATERSMVAMAIAMGKDEELSDTKVLILDEADASVPEDEAKRFLAKARKAAKLGIPVIMVTHRLKSVMEMCDDATILNDGKVVYSGTLSGIDQDFIISKMLKSEQSLKTEERVGISRLWDSVGSTLQQKKEGALLQVDDLYADKIQGISFALNRGEILGIVGMSDSGTAELPYILGGSGKWKSGEIRLDGEKLPKKMTPGKGIERGISLVPTDRPRQGGVMNRTLRENVILPLENRFFLKNKKAYEAVETAIEELDIRPPLANQQFAKFSGGNQQKSIVAKWLFTCPKVLVLDDPTYGVDPGARIKIFAALKESARNHVGIIVFSTEPEQLASLCDRVIVLRKGEIAHELLKSDGTLTRKSIARWCYV
ncbi:ribose import ATP-binding protein RbsA [Lachnospiraceae bacterium]|uniref:ATP-binding cassette domain-containing protein n=1 Tax=Extibacter sp. GGCC_0201 TaxID=2731209 RepID=UPI001AA119E9|nr:sugar ABC transporter ATP-binding protein [Extibacter sp. GGCC_0201]MBO1721879.1 sugar ABC transporter ATP-binding protein [Extibacter sp. GGCC_0201]BDF35064.1 ribose import ATP-binding protein RbsA [Lachnospiraceae bacterium]BDF39065.1 ribose import ATP-binding protein RbsA [Lachnospiraceae bacterium]